MAARIFRPAKTAMQSGKGNTRQWVLNFDVSEPRKVEPLMGYTSSTDMLSQVRLSFETAEQAVAYCEANGIEYRVEEEKPVYRAKVSYSDNFRYDRAQPWTH